MKESKTLSKDLNVGDADQLLDDAKVALNRTRENIAVSRIQIDSSR